LWVESDTMGLFLRYTDADGVQWIQLNGMADLASYVSKLGDTMSGTLIIRNTAPAIVLDKTLAGSASHVQGKYNDLFRWVIHLGDTTAESGANAGSNFAIYGYTDAGAYLNTPLTINRATGRVTAIGVPPLPQATAGIGQWAQILSGTGAIPYLPAGGTWAYLMMGTNASSGIVNYATSTGIAAGGTALSGAVASVIWSGMCWRIA